MGIRVGCACAHVFYWFTLTDHKFAEARISIPPPGGSGNQRDRVREEVRSATRRLPPRSWLPGLITPGGTAKPCWLDFTAEIALFCGVWVSLRVSEHTPGKYRGPTALRAYFSARIPCRPLSFTSQACGSTRCLVNLARCSP